MITEIAIDCTETELKLILKVLEGYALCDNIRGFYVEPSNHFVSLEDCECQCEGK